MRIELFPYIMIWCLILTIIIETSLAFIIGLRKKDLVYVILVNVLTNPLLNGISIYILINYGLRQKRISVIIMEILVLFVEGFVYKRNINYKKINPYILSLILNGTSYGIGIILDLLT